MPVSARHAPPQTLPDSTVRAIQPLYEMARRYHRYRVVGLENLPQDGAGLVVFNHSLATYDILLFGATVYFQRQRLMVGLADRLIFKTPLLRTFAAHISGVQGEPEAARSVLESGRLVAVAPGGMREALRPSRRKYQLAWERRVGFARLAMETGVPVFLAACPRADDIYTVYENPVTRLAYEKLRIPVPLARGRMLTALPRPIPLTHLVSEAMVPPALTKGVPGDDQVRAFQVQLVARMQRLMSDALAL